MSEDSRVVKYLKGETIEFTDADQIRGTGKGWILVCVDGYPLGFGKAQNGIIKNKYLPGWRMMS
jgi:NOL1/NOP2/fmu family ribosome biogenesis protein